MDGLLKLNSYLVSTSSQRYKIIKFLGAGGQGEVYDVECNGKHYALKWYYKHMATKEQKAILDNLIAKGAPDSSFLWPQDLILAGFGQSFGYIMPLRPKNFKSIVDMMKRRAEPTFYALCLAAYNLTNGYQKLHSMGYSYRDISFGNLFFDPDTGEVLICDNDNVSANGKDDSSVYGTPRFMAPEIVVGKAKPSRNTDLYSLSVLLFYMFMMGHPLEGKLEADIKCMDIHAMNKLYGTNPVFIYDPVNKTNRPIKGYQDNVIIYWDLYPQTLRDLFTQSFTTGLTEPNKRVTEKKWMDAFANLMSGIVKCSCNSTDATLHAFRMIKNLSDGYGLTRDAATWAVVSWCYILGKTEIANALEEIPSNSIAPASSHSFGQTHIIGIGTYKAGFDFKAGDIKLRHLTKDLQSPGMVKGVCVLRGHSIECYKNTSSSSKGAKKIASFADSCHLEIEEGEYLILKVDTWADTDLIKIELTEYV